MTIQVTESTLLSRLMKLCLEDEETSAWDVIRVTRAFCYSVEHRLPDEAYKEMPEYADCLNRIYDVLEEVKGYDEFMAVMSRTGDRAVLETLIALNTDS